MPLYGVCKSLAMSVTRAPSHGFIASDFNTYTCACPPPMRTRSLTTGAFRARWRRGLDGDGRAGADARAVMRDGCATVRRSETRAMKRSACAEVERTRRRARADAMWDTSRAESRLAESALGRNGTVADVHERASRIAYILVKLLSTVGGGPRDGVWVKITKRAAGPQATAAKNKSYDGSRDLLKQTSAECGDEANECDACDAGGADGELDERIDADDGSAAAAANRAPVDVEDEDVDRWRQGSPVPVPPRPTTRSVTLSLTIPFGARVRTTRRITVSRDARRRLANFIRPTSVASHRRLRVEQRLEQIVQIVRAHPSTVREPPNPGPPGNPPPNPPPGNPPAPGRPPRIACSLNARSISRIKLELSFPNISLNTLSASSRVKSFLYSYL